LKHASNVWKCGELIDEIFSQAGYPDGVFQFLPISSDQVGEVLEHPAVQAVSLTGSKPAGGAVASRAASLIKKSVLELGGSNALVVFEDADLDRTLETCIQARFQNAGQSCIAGKRLLVQESIAGPFLERLLEKVKALRSGDPEDPDTFIGVLAREDLAKDLEKQMQDSLAMGARLRCGGQRRGAYFEPTVLDGVLPGMPAFEEETFGPLLAVTSFKTEAEALSLVSRSEFGLGVSLFTASRERALRLIPQLDEGAVFVNELVKSDPRLPFGGVKISGYGRELSREGIREFVNRKTVYLAH
jgi:succinate-semialdehyde dehydrogenase/glutarate-semialdehyde dehydrogenase